MSLELEASTPTPYIPPPIVINERADNGDGYNVYTTKTGEKFAINGTTLYAKDASAGAKFTQVTDPQAAQKYQAAASTYDYTLKGNTLKVSDDGFAKGETKDGTQVAIKDGWAFAGAKDANNVTKWDSTKTVKLDSAEAPKWMKDIDKTASIEKISVKEDGSTVTETTVKSPPITAKLGETTITGGASTATHTTTEPSPAATKQALENKGYNEMKMPGIKGEILGAAWREDKAADAKVKIGGEKPSPEVIKERAVMSVLNGDPIHDAAVWHAAAGGAPSGSEAQKTAQSLAADFLNLAATPLTEQERTSHEKFLDRLAIHNERLGVMKPEERPKGSESFMKNFNDFKNRDSRYLGTQWDKMLTLQSFGAKYITDNRIHSITVPQKNH